MAASYIPNGYRLLTAEDAGKVFGTDLEPNFYIDNTVTPNFATSTCFINLGARGNGYIESINISNLNIYFWDSESDEYALYTHGSQGSWSSNYDYTQPFVVSPIYGDTYDPLSYSDVDYVNNWLYVKDIATDPYNITLTKPKLTVKCADMTMEKDLVVQATVYDGTVEGGKAVDGFIIEVSTAAEMNSLLTTSEVNTIYKYVGETTATYESGALYIVEESE